jgi:hypothetical protein
LQRCDHCGCDEGIASPPKAVKQSNGDKLNDFRQVVNNFVSLWDGLRQGDAKTH